MPRILDRRRFPFCKHRPLLLSSLLLFAAMLDLGWAATAHALTSIVVDASRIGSLSGGDDLEAARNMFQGANSPSEPWSEPQRTLLKQVMTDLRMKRLRFLQTDSLCDLDDNYNLGSVAITGTDANGAYTFGPVTPGGCDMLDWTFPWSFDNELSLHVAVASFIPPSFTRNVSSAENWPSQDRYKIYADRLVRYIVTKAFDAGLRSVIFEVSNELDGADNEPQNWSRTNPSAYTLKQLSPFGRWLWWINPASYTLNQWPAYQADTYPYDNAGLSYPYAFDMRRLDHGILPVQKIFADTIAAVRAELAGDGRYSGRTIEIAGPAFTGRSFFYFPGRGLPTMEEVFLDQILTPGTRFHSVLDRFSFHFYGSLDYSVSQTAPFPLFRQIVAAIRRKLAALGHPEVKLFVSEWGPSEAYDGDVNYSHKGAAWAAAFLTEAVAQNISMGSYLMLEDGQGDPRVAPYTTQASLMYKHQDIHDHSIWYYPKPAANLFRMFAIMTGTRRPVTLSPSDASSNLGAFAASDPDKRTAGIIVFNYDPTLVFGNNDNALPDAPERFSVEIDNLPLADGLVTVQRYLIDAKTSNLHAFLNLPNHPDPNLKMVEQFPAPVVNGKVVLPERSLGLGVTFWRIKG